MPALIPFISAVLPEGVICTVAGVETAHERLSWLSEGTVSAFTSAVSPISSVSFDGYSFMDFRLSDAAYAEPTTIFTCAVTLSIVAVTIAVPAFLGENEKLLYAVFHSIAPFWSSTDQMTLLSVMYEPVADRTSARTV